MESSKLLTSVRLEFCALCFSFALIGCGSDDARIDATRPWFSDIADDIGVNFRHISGASDAFLLPEIMGSGVALFDVENDGDLDVYFVQSGGQFTANDRRGNQLYLNDGTGLFTLAESTGLEDTGYGMGVATGDYDKDGLVDVYVTNVGKNRLFRNVGDGRFADVTAQAQVFVDGFSTASVFGDFDADGYLDLFVVNYVHWDITSERACYDYGTGARNYCDPGNYDKPTPDTLYRNNGDGTFIDVTLHSGIASSRGNGLGVVVSDVNGDGLLDIYVANDKTPNHLWINQGDFTFSNEAFARNAAIDDHGIAKAGMGVVARDVDQDTDVDIIVVNIQGETDSYYRNDGDYFTDAAAQVGLTRFSRSYTRFGIALVDFNHDGRLDFYEGNGRVTFSTESATDDPYAEPNTLFRGSRNAQFEFVPPANVHTQTLIHTSRGVAAGDLDDDGAVDLVVVNRDAPAYVLHNLTNGTGTWLSVDLHNPSGSPDLNAQLLLDTDLGFYRGEVQVGGSYLAANSSTIHMTFHAAPVVLRTTVRWSDGAVQEIQALRLNRRSVITRNDDHVLRDD